MNSVWIVKLPAEWKDIFDDLAHDAGYYGSGIGAREVRRMLRAWLTKEGHLEELSLLPLKQEMKKE